MVNRKILIPLDEALMTQPLLEFIISLASKNDFSLLLLKNENNGRNSVPLSPLEQADELEVDYKLLTVDGFWSHDINEYAELHGVDLIAMRVDENDNCTDLIKDIERPSLLFPATWQPRDIKRMAFACDNHSFQDSTVLTILWYLAMELKAEVYIVHISERPIDKWALKQSVEDSIEFYLQDIEHYYEFIHSSNVTESLLRFSEEKGIDLLATMPRNHQINKLENGGRVTGQLIEKAPIPIITID